MEATLGIEGEIGEEELLGGALSQEDSTLKNVSKECKTRVVALVEGYGGERDGIRGVLENGGFG